MKNLNRIPANGKACAYTVHVHKKLVHKALASNVIRCVIIFIDFLPIVFVAGDEGPISMRHIIICVVTASTKNLRVKYEILKRAAKLCRETRIFSTVDGVGTKMFKLYLACPVHEVTRVSTCTSYYTQTRYLGVSLRLAYNLYSPTWYLVVRRRRSPVVAPLALLDSFTSFQSFRAFPSRVAKHKLRCLVLIRRLSLIYHTVSLVYQTMIARD